MSQCERSSFVRSFVRSFAVRHCHCPSLRSHSVVRCRSFNHSLIHSFIRSFVRSFVGSFVRSSVGWLVRSLFHSLVGWLVAVVLWLLHVLCVGGTVVVVGVASFDHLSLYLSSVAVVCVLGCCWC